VQLSKSVPTIARERFRCNLEEACSSLGLDFDEITHFVLHPGGSRVLDAFEEALGLQAGGLTTSRDVLRDCGNMSSVTVLFILERFLGGGERANGSLGVLSAMGPGFSAEHVFFRC
jgi:alkylresorcinol/alkylpyrone synthase